MGLENSKSTRIMEICPISNNPIIYVFSNTVLGKYDIRYYFCEECGFLKTEKPYWLDEAYQDAIADTDIGLAARNIGNSQTLTVVLQLIYNGQGKFLDVAGGYGLLARRLRDYGIDCYTTDMYCQNIFAIHFEPGDDFVADALFAFEVIEHIGDPYKFITQIFQTYGCKTLFFSTATFQMPVPDKSWWYYMPETGQHISFYQLRTLKYLAMKLGCEYYQIVPGLHLITDRPISKWHIRILNNKHLKRIYSIYAFRKRMNLSKMDEDYKFIKKQID